MMRSAYRRAWRAVAVAAVIAAALGASVAPAGAAPRWVVSPQVAGPPTVGSELQAKWVVASTGVPPSAVDTAFAWERCEDSNSASCSPVPNNNPAPDRYTTTDADYAKFLRVRITAHDANDNTTSTRVSAAFGPIADAELAGSYVDSLLPPTGAGAPSDDCSTGGGVNLVEGYLGTLYARAKVLDDGAEIWVCSRLQEENGNLLSGGKFALRHPTSAVQVDDRYDACEAPGNILMGPHPADRGTINGVPYLLDAHANYAAEASVCFRAGIAGYRVGVSGLPPLFERDHPTTPVPPRTPWRTGLPSSDCARRAVDTSGEIMNVRIRLTRIWLGTWVGDGASRSQICVRVEDPSRSAGAVLAVDAQPPGVTPILDVTEDAAGCDEPLFSSGSADLAVRYGVDNPASVCVTQGGVTNRVTVGFSGNPSFTPDP